MTRTGFVSTKLTPALTKSPRFGISEGDVVIAFVAVRNPINSSSSQPFVVVCVVVGKLSVQTMIDIVTSCGA